MIISRGCIFVPLGTLLEEYSQTQPVPVIAEVIPGRDGWVSCQKPAGYSRESGSGAGIPDMLFPLKGYVIDPLFVSIRRSAVGATSSFYRLETACSCGPFYGPYRIVKF